MKISTENIYWVYILHCENGSYYTGYTNNLTKRFMEHMNGTSRCKYTRSFKPTHLVQCWQIQESKSLAMKLEKYIKSLSRLEKERLIKDPTHLTQDTRVSVFNS
jgi:putative endonuclease